MVKTILIDCDGVLTDGKVYFDSKGNRTKGFHSRDIRAIRELISHGFDVHIITQSHWPGINDFAKRTGAHIIMDREKNLNGFSDYFAIGDDTPDMEILKNAKKAFCPSDADKEVKSIEGIIVLDSKGGEGVISDFVSIIEKI